MSLVRQASLLQLCTVIARPHVDSRDAIYRYLLRMLTQRCRLLVVRLASKPSKG